MKKILAILCCLALVFCLTACGKEPELEEPSTGSIPVSSNTLTSTKPQKPTGIRTSRFPMRGFITVSAFPGIIKLNAAVKPERAMCILIAHG